MREADMAIAGGGQTLYELAATGTPTIAVQLFDNQASSVAGLVELGAVLDGGRFDGTKSLRAMTSRVHELMRDAELRRSCSRQGQAVVDGRGAERVAAVMRDAA